MKLKLLSLIALAISFQAYSQTEYFVKLDNQTGKLEKIKKINNVGWTTMGCTVFDAKNQQYIFQGGETNLPNTGKLYTVDLNGSVINNPPSPGTSTSNIANIAQNQETGQIYGLRWDRDESMEYFVSIDPKTGTFKDLDKLPTVAAIVVDEAVIDARNNYYIFRGIDTAKIQRIYTININTSTIKSSPQFTTDTSRSFTGIQYDESLQKIYSFCTDYAQKKNFLTSLDPSTGGYSIIKEIPNIRKFAGLSGTTYDINNHYFIFRSVDRDSQNRVYTIDVQTGNIVYNPIIQGLKKGDYLHYTEHLPNSTALYGLLWESNTSFIDDIESTGFNVYPNPFKKTASIQFQNNLSDVAIAMYDMTGRLVKATQARNTSTVYLDREGLTPGVYFVKMRVDDQAEKTVKVIVE